ncbi:outer membrane murein-binding lipoprotein Lpp [Janthinobacterium sp. CG_S6]|nr:outer membrane murein-binding lipoprotein Lpp [Janthinobacterium sp. CG_S6]
MICMEAQVRITLPEILMAAIAFDTLKMAERLESAGMPAAQAKMQATVLAEVITAEDASIVDRFSSKQDVAVELAAIKAGIEKLDSKISQSAAEFKALNSDTKAELIRWVVSVGILQMALVAGLVLKLVK